VNHEQVRYPPFVPLPIQPEDNLGGSTGGGLVMPNDEFGPLCLAVSPPCCQLRSSLNHEQRAQNVENSAN